MARRPKFYHREPNEWLACPVYGCSRKFRNQSGRTKHIRAKHKKNDKLQTPTQSRTRATGSVSSESSFDAIPIDLDPQPEVPYTPHHDVQVASDLGSPLDGRNMTRSPITTGLQLHHDNDPSSPPHFQPEVEIYHDSDQLEAEQASTSSESSTNYHPFINGMTLQYFLIN